MPFYDLKCSECEGEFNIIATMADKQSRSIPCPDCGSTELETLYKSAPAYIKSTGTQMPACASGGGCGASCPHSA